MKPKKVVRTCDTISFITNFTSITLSDATKSCPELGSGIAGRAVGLARWAAQKPLTSEKKKLHDPQITSDPPGH